MRETCRRCLRPTDFCFCDGLPLIPTRTRVVLLQHPREARLAICSARLTHLALAESELYCGLRFAGHDRVRALASQPGAYLLYPGEGAVAADSLTASPPAHLFVIDGTWKQAEKMLRENPLFAALPRVSISGVASGYAGLRREPGPDRLSTLEAVACALEAFEGDPTRFAPMRAAFRRMVEQQLTCAKGERRNPRHRRRPAASL